MRNHDFVSFNFSFGLFFSISFFNFVSFFSPFSPLLRPPSPFVLNKRNLFLLLWCDSGGTDNPVGPLSVAFGQAWGPKRFKKDGLRTKRFDKKTVQGWGVIIFFWRASIARILTMLASHKPHFFSSSSSPSSSSFLHFFISFPSRTVSGRGHTFFFPYSLPRRNSVQKKKYSGVHPRGCLH